MTQYPRCDEVVFLSRFTRRKNKQKQQTEFFLIENLWTVPIKGNLNLTLLPNMIWNPTSYVAYFKTKVLVKNI